MAAAPACASLRAPSRGPTARALAAIAIVAAETLASSLAGQTPRLTPPPPCRAPAADSAQWLGLRPASRSGTIGLAVLELQSRVLDASQAHLAWAVTTALRSGMTTIPGARVESPGTVERAFASVGGRIDSLVSVLGDDYVVSGDVGPQRDRIEISVRIAERNRDTPRWERAFSYPRTPIPQIEESVVGALREILGSGSIAVPPKMSVASYEMALRGDYFLQQHDAVSADSARRVYERALEEDPISAILPARIARARAEALERSGRLDTRLVGEQVLAGMAMADTALKRDSTNADAWTARAMLLRYRNLRTYDGTTAAHDRAIARAPSSADAHYQYGVTLMRLGRDAAAEQHFRRALALEPNDAAVLRALGELEYLHRRYGASCALANASIGADSYDPLSYALRARVRIQQGEFRDAFSDAETALRISAAPWGDALQVLVSANAATVDDARLQARRVASARLRPGVTMSLAEGVYTSLAFEALGDRTRALEALRRIDPAGVQLAMALRDPGFDQMRGDARFRRILTTAGKTARADSETSSGTTMKRLTGSIPP
jgi:tetratricopeptide (TPR) repeat protein